jgi:chitin disaccharide deacetylase
VNSASNPPRIIINADDFGISADANKAIVQAFEGNRISSTTLMANMPAFDEACDVVHRAGLVGKVGVHVNLTEGRPMSKPILGCPRFCDPTGQFRSRQTHLWLSRKEMLAVETEIDAQIGACVDRGISPTHLDSHHHVHTEWAIGAIVIAVARRYGLKAIRLTRNCGSGIGFTSKLYKWAYNYRLKRSGLAKTQYFGSIRDVETILADGSADIEVMVHLTAERRSVHVDCGDDLALISSSSTHRLVSYS